MIKAKRFNFKQKISKSSQKNLLSITSQNNPSPTSAIFKKIKINYMRLDTLKWNNHTFKELTKKAKLIY